jgi:hypothetical protein
MPWKNRVIQRRISFQPAFFFLFWSTLIASPGKLPVQVFTQAEKDSFRLQQDYNYSVAFIWPDSVGDLRIEPLLPWQWQNLDLVSSGSRTSKLEADSANYARQRKIFLLVFRPQRPGYASLKAAQFFVQLNNVADTLILDDVNLLVLPPAEPRNKASGWLLLAIFILGNIFVLFLFFQRRLRRHARN